MRTVVFGSLWGNRACWVPQEGIGEPRPSHVPGIWALHLMPHPSPRSSPPTQDWNIWNDSWSEMILWSLAGVSSPTRKPKEKDDVPPSGELRTNDIYFMGVRGGIGLPKWYLGVLEFGPTGPMQNCGNHQDYFWWCLEVGDPQVCAPQDWGVHMVTLPSEPSPQKAHVLLEE